MHTTCELRCFWRRKAPLELKQWFESISRPSASRQESRTDCYGVLPGVAGLSMKRARGNVEVKGLVRVREVQSLAGVLGGRMEVWQKWTCPLDSVEFKDSIAIAKSRFLTSFTVSGPGEPFQGGSSAAPSAEPIRGGCNLELAELILERKDGSQDWETFAIEAWGELDQVESNFLFVLEFLQNQCGLNALTGVLHSNPGQVDSYASWLARLY